ncbi:unnamed protein product [Urochloa decumbens]|uniref:Uncharacterized protein n=1 Tax=Urochloa decumbens TaxID=240449 RepID=A0ABC9ELI8_9POAL
MDGGVEDKWDDSCWLDEVFRAIDEAVASRNPNPTPTPAPAPTPASALAVSFLPAVSVPAPVSCLPAASYSSPAPRFSPPPELTQRPPVASSDGEAMSVVGRGFSPPPELSQRPAADEGDLAIVGASGPMGGHVAAKRERESREVEKLKRELSRASKQINELKNECTELRKDRTKKDLQIKAKEVEIQNLKKANVFASKDVCSAGMDIDTSFHAPANGALHAGGSSWASTRQKDKANGKDNNANSLELRRGTMIDNGISTSGVLPLEENTDFEPRSIMCKEIKAIGVQTDSTSDSGQLECKKILVERISSNLRAILGMATNSLSRRNLISKIIISCSEEILSLLQCTRLTDNCETSHEANSSINEAISQVHDMFIKMNNEKIPIQTFLEALLNLCIFDNAAIVRRTLRILLSILQHLLNYYGTKSSGRTNVSVEPYVNVHMENHHKDSSTVLSSLDAENLSKQHNMSLPFTFWSSVFTVMLQIVVKYPEDTIRTDALSIMILVLRTTDPKEERHRFRFTSVMTGLHLLLQKENGLLVKKNSVRLLFLLLNCPVMLKLLCSGGKDGSEEMESEGCESDRSQVISSVLVDLSECLSCEATCSLEIELCRLVIVLLAYIASSSKLGYEVLLGPVSAHGASFLELIMQVLASQMQYEAQELLKERCLLMREALILLNRLASHANFSKPTLEVLTSSKLCATLTIDVANRLPQTRMTNDLAELAQKFRSRLYAFLEEKPLTFEC